MVELALRASADGDLTADVFVHSFADVGPPFAHPWLNPRGTVRASTTRWTSGTRVVIEYTLRGGRGYESANERIAVVIP